MRILAFAFSLAALGPVDADVVVPARTIRAKEILTAQDLLVKSATLPGTVDRLADAIGQEARVALYPGRPVRAGDIGPPAVIDRNQHVTLEFLRGNLRIVAEGRALGRGAIGDVIRVMNLSSRTTLSGTIKTNGVVTVK